ncbi:MAG: SlyX family protein [Moraxellaceae bacterium]|jgi:SlyX protein|nr:SlyX family protein [Moraxellaceae bacterium]MBP8852477.1 SlyX family protein [Moraxellaceae bacterium]MBP9046371.1 SlyX family protein [Moraxellaceae bacterium]MBP9731197.1 SlyX family protein [Moraxellaceae bacterium]MCC6199825.1 SlyX family protein [Moraxellaceae bacterium]
MESRLNDLETKVAFQDELLETLNTIVAEQQQQLDLIQRELRLVYEQVKTLSPSDIANSDDQERPPHY